MLASFLFWIYKQFYDDDVNNGNTAIAKLAEVYKNDVCCMDVASEYRSFKLVYKDIFPVYNDGLNLKACEILTFLIANDMHVVFPNVSTLYKLFMTLPVSRATAERSFSRLKLIKSYLRSTMSESRFTNLALLSIERELTNNLDFDSVVDTQYEEQTKMAINPTNNQHMQSFYYYVCCIL